MLASVLRSEIAIQTSILITRVFVALRKLIVNSPIASMLELQKELKELRKYVE